MLQVDELLSRSRRETEILGHFVKKKLDNLPFLDSFFNKKRLETYLMRMIWLRFGLEQEGAP